MNDISTFTTTFQGDWNSVMKFLTGVMDRSPIRKIRIVKQQDQGWKVDVNGSMQKKKQKPVSYAGLYDLNW